MLSIACPSGHGVLTEGNSWRGALRAQLSQPIEGYKSMTTPDLRLNQASLITESSWNLKMQNQILIQQVVTLTDLLADIGKMAGLSAQQINLLKARSASLSLLQTGTKKAPGSPQTQGL